MKPYIDTSVPRRSSRLRRLIARLTQGRRYGRPGEWWMKESGDVFVRGWR